MEQLTKALQSGDALNFFISAGGYFIERPVWQVVGVIAGCGYALVLMWMFTAWGAYRELTSLSRFRSGLAFMLFCMLSVPITIIMTMIAAALTSKLS